MAISPMPYGPGPQDIRPFTPQRISPLLPPLDQFREADKIRREDAVRQIRDSYPLVRFPDFFDPNR